MLKKILKWVEQHPIIPTVLSLVVVAMPGWVGSVWLLYSNEPPVQVVGRRLGGVEMPTFSAYWFTGSIGLLILAVVVYVVVMARRRIKVIEEAIESAAAIPREEKRNLSTPVRHSWELIREQSPVS